MRLAVLGESPADEAALRVLVEGILERKVELADGYRLRARGWPYVRQVLPAVFKYLYRQTRADALAVIVDSDHTSIHKPEHEQPGGADEYCRLCQLHDDINKVRKHLRPVHGRAEIKVAIGLATPAIEAWFQCVHNRGVSESAWENGLESGSYPYTKKQLKRRVYGTRRPTLDLELKRMAQEARLLVTNLELAEERFPGGFGALVRSIRGWHG